MDGQHVSHAGGGANVCLTRGGEQQSLVMMWSGNVELVPHGAPYFARGYFWMMWDR